MKLEDLNNKVIKIIRNNVSDPRSRSGNWVYVGYPRKDCTFPRISVVCTSNTTEAMALGEYAGDSTYGEWHNTTYDIDIWIKKGNSFSISGKTKSGSLLRDYLADEVVQAFFDKKDDMAVGNSVGGDTSVIQDVIISGPVSTPYDNELELYRSAVTITFMHMREVSSGER